MPLDAAHPRLTAVCVNPRALRHPARCLWARAASWARTTCTSYPEATRRRPAQRARTRSEWGWRVGDVAGVGINHGSGPMVDETEGARCRRDDVHGPPMSVLRC